MRPARSRFGLVILTGAICGFGVAEAAPKAKVSLVAFSSGIVAEKPIELGVRYELEPGWHIYWQNPGDAGAPPSVRWTLPDGFTASDPEFPAPKSHVSPGDIVTNVLKGEPVLLFTVQPPSALTVNEVSIKARVVSFVCEQECIQETAQVELTLPVLASADQIKAINEDVLKSARKKQPKQTSSALSIKPEISPGSVTAGSKFDLLVRVTIGDKLHIQSNTPTAESLIPAEIFLQRAKDIRFERAQFPTPKMRKDKIFGELSEFAGEITIRVPAEVDAHREPGPLKIKGVFSYQACTDAGNCLPPEALGFTLPVNVLASAAGAEPGGVALTAAPTAPTSEVQEPVAAGSAMANSAAPRSPESASSTQPQGVEGVLRSWGLGGLLLGCFLYGLFINATPCVLPLLSIKVLGFVQQAHESRKKTLILGLTFGAGVIVFFVALGLLSARIGNILQYPLAVIALGAVVMAMGLSMLGVFTLHVPTSATNLESRIHQEGPLASFAKGALAPVLGFACTGPLLAGAFGWATTQPPERAIMAFAIAGFGMASPYMLLGANPNWLSFLPRPGMWMITFERIMGFMLLAMVIWMVHPLSVQIGVVGLELTLVFYVVVAMACWVLGKIQITMPTVERWKYRATAMVLVLLSSAVVYGWAFPLDNAQRVADAEREQLMECRANGAVTTRPDEIVWRPWSPEAVTKAVAQGKLAFVDFTAAYCTVCKVNKKVAIDTPEVREVLSNPDVVAFQGDFTTGDDQIETVLRSFSRAGVPLNLIYPPGRPDAPLVLETNLTTNYLLKKFSEARGIKEQSASIRGQ